MFDPDLNLLFNQHVNQLRILLDCSSFDNSYVQNFIYSENCLMNTILYLLENYKKYEQNATLFYDLIHIVHSLTYYETDLIKDDFYMRLAPILLDILKDIRDSSIIEIILIALGNIITNNEKVRDYLNSEKIYDYLYLIAQDKDFKHCENFNDIIENVLYFSMKYVWVEPSLQPDCYKIMFDFASEGALYDEKAYIEYSCKIIR